MKKITIAVLLVGLSMSLFAGRADIYIEECNDGMAEMCHMAAQFYEAEKKQDKANTYYMKAMKIMKRECSESDANACDNMGDFYLKGLGVKKSKAEAKKSYLKSAKLFKKKCTQGDKNSCSMIDYVENKHKVL